MPVSVSMSLCGMINDIYDMPGHPPRPYPTPMRLFLAATPRRVRRSVPRCRRPCWPHSRFAVCSGLGFRDYYQETGIIIRKQGLFLDISVPTNNTTLESTKISLVLHIIADKQHTLSPNLIPNVSSKMYALRAVTLWEV